MTEQVFKVLGKLGDRNTGVYAQMHEALISPTLTSLLSQRRQFG